MLALHLSNIIWSIVSLTLIILVNYRIGQILSLKTPLQQQQAEIINQKLKDLQTQVDSLVLSRTFTEYDK